MQCLMSRGMGSVGSQLSGHFTHICSSSPFMKKIVSVREGVNWKKNVFFRALPEWWGGVYPCPNFLALFLEVHFWSIKESISSKMAMYWTFNCFLPSLAHYSIPFLPGSSEISTKLSGWAIAGKGTKYIALSFVTGTPWEVKVFPPSFCHFH